MMKFKIIFFILSSLLFVSLSNAQVKIGDNPSVIDGNSILELESSDKVLVISRMTTVQMNAITPLRGALVYNIDASCVYMYNGTSWKSLCGGSTTTTGINVTTAPTAPVAINLGDFWINNTQNDLVHIWDGANWIPMDNNPKKGTGVPNATTVTNPIAGDVYVDSSTGNIYAYDGTTWVQSGGGIKANNGLLVTPDNTVQLGGALVKPTIITTTPTNTLAIEGLLQGNLNDDEIVTINKTTGQLRKIDVTNILREEVVKLIAIDGQDVFDTGFTLKSQDKVNVYRNGVRVDISVDLPSNKITLTDPETKCYAGDEIRIVQFY